MAHPVVVVDAKLDLPGEIRPPTQAGAQLTASGTYSYAVDLRASATKPTNEQYYAALRSAVVSAKEDLGERLTAWRDAVGDREKEKEGAVVGKKVPKPGEEEEMEDEEDEEEEGEE
ncbi:hypothetical protein DACRYDRAFT_21823 [Dacryopinax primogenitus]|uniref:EKC/KEOPS complex subunit GON7 n=1 Tax=Dacryopinax primogenitus (strain DJM 731) TaxID=1858805 RepID=M5G3T1_DACPD|nr:uncharacterized protein DACRYDRAFT_21823 [Dacryopinax primogenitus]EJU02870.1 hypothetical protein DACRYDRAFT_21823 [Dacryopinax primogenitus]